MFSTWLTLQQMTAAIRQGRLDDAYRLAREPVLRGHQRAGELLVQLKHALIERANRYLQSKDLLAAWRDVQQAEAVGPGDGEVSRLKEQMVESSIKAVRGVLEAGQPQAALERIESYRQGGLAAGPFAILEELAKGWLEAQELAARGEFGLALARLDPLPYRPIAALVQYHALLTERLRAFQAMREELYEALARENWKEVIRLADGLLVIAPDHSEIRKARTKAWRALQPATQAYQQPSRPAPPPEPKPEADTLPPRDPEFGLPRRVLLWVDGVGGFLVCFQPRVSLGSATNEGTVDIPLFADVSRLHAYLNRDAEGYTLEALRPTTVQGRMVERTPLNDGDEIGLGETCKLRFRQSVAISNTACLTITSGHRLPLALDGILLMAETCILGDGIDAHIHVPGLGKRVILVRRKEELLVQTAGEIEVDRVKLRDRAALTMQSTVAGADFRFALEPIGNQFGRR
jgi:hypothetical protein